MQYKNSFNDSHLAAFDIVHHPLEIGTVEIRSRVSIIHIHCAYGVPAIEVFAQPTAKTA